MRLRIHGRNSRCMCTGSYLDCSGRIFHCTMRCGLMSSSLCPRKRTLYGVYTMCSSCHEMQRRKRCLMKFKRLRFSPSLTKSAIACNLVSAKPFNCHDLSRQHP